MQELNESTLKAFVDAISHFFRQFAGTDAEVKSAYLVEPGQELPRYEFTGMISVGGDYSGCLYFSAPRGLLTHLLLVAGEHDYSEEQHLDLVGEVANQLSGQARRQLGSGLEIAVPVRLHRAEGQISPAMACRPYVILLEWNGYPALVVVQLAAASR